MDHARTTIERQSATIRTLQQQWDELQGDYFRLQRQSNEGSERQRLIDAALAEEVARQKHIISQRRAAMRAAIGASQLMQRVFRGYRARADLRKQKAASTRIQATWRGKQGRQEGDERRRDRRHRDAAATQIQRVARGRVARGEVTDLRNKHAAATRIQAAGRGAAARREGRAKEAAAVRIQAAGRGHLARERVAGERAVVEARACRDVCDAIMEEVVADIAVEAADESLDAANEENGAAVDIQRAVRRRLARDKACVGACLVVGESQLLASAYQCGGLCLCSRKEAAALTIQRAERHRQAVTLQHKQDNAAVKIQSAARQKQAKRRVYVPFQPACTAARGCRMTQPWL